MFLHAFGIDWTLLLQQIFASVRGQERALALQIRICRRQPHTNLFEYHIPYLRPPHLPHKLFLILCSMKIIPSNVVDLLHFLANVPVWELLECPSACLTLFAMVRNDTAAAASHIHPT